MFTKSLTLFLSFCLASTIIAAEAPKKKLTPEEIAVRRAEMKKRRYERTGGYVVKPDNNIKVLALVNVNNTVDKELLTKLAKEMEQALLFNVVASVERPANAGVVIEIKDTDYPATFITAPENGYGMLNVRPLKIDNPSKEKLERRTIQQIWRTTILTLGGGYDIEPKCLMKPFASVQELDSCPSICPCPMSFSAVVAAAARFGVNPIYRATYKRACEEGWAPAPTNDVQKAIWDNVHATPKNPLKIEFDPEKGR